MKGLNRLNKNILFRILITSIMIVTAIFIFTKPSGENTYDYYNQISAKYQNSSENYGYDLSAVEILISDSIFTKDDIKTIWEIIDLKEKEYSSIRPFSRSLGFLWRKKSNNEIDWVELSYDKRGFVFIWKYGEYKKVSTELHQYFINRIQEQFR